MASSSALPGLFIVAAKRTPFGAFGGALKNHSATQLGAIASQAALLLSSNSTSIDPKHIDQVVFGNVIPSSADAAYLARHVGLQVGCKIDTPSLTINRLCGSGFETAIQACQLIQLNQAQVVLSGGTESMSQAPLQVDGHLSRWGTPLGKGLQLRDALWDGLTDAHVSTPMGMTAENLAKDHGISRQDCDAYAHQSQQLWKAAHEAGKFTAELAPVEITMKNKKTSLFDTDEHPRPSATLEKMSSLPPVFSKDGVVTAANSSGICDGAGAVIVASEAAVLQHGWTPLARIVSYAVTGCPPTHMGIGPVSAITRALEAANKTLDDMDRVEINEAFAAQVLACAKELNVDRSKLNLQGGAISLGHPLGASGSRILAHLAHSLANSSNGETYAVGSACIGGGQGIAVVLEKA